MVRQAEKCWFVPSSLCVHYAVLSAPYLNINPKSPQRGCSHAQEVENLAPPGETIAATPLIRFGVQFGCRSVNCRALPNVHVTVTQTHGRMVAGHIATLASRFPVPQKFICTPCDGHCPLAHDGLTYEQVQAPAVRHIFVTAYLLARITGSASSEDSCQSAVPRGAAEG